MEYLSQRGAQGPRPAHPRGPFRRGHQRREQQQHAQVGVAADGRRGLPPRAQDALPWRQGRVGERRARRRRAALEVGVAHAVAGRIRADVARFRRTRLVQESSAHQALHAARPAAHTKPAGGADVSQPPAAAARAMRAARPSTISPAISVRVSACRPFQAGTLLTSNSHNRPAASGSRSTPA